MEYERSIDYGLKAIFVSYSVSDDGSKPGGRKLAPTGPSVSVVSSSPNAEMGVLAITMTPTGATHETRAGLMITRAHTRSSRFQYTEWSKQAEECLHTMALRRQLYDDAILAHIDDLRAELGGKGADSSEVPVLQL